MAAGSVLDQAVALEACAHELVPGPLLSTAVAALVWRALAPRSATAPPLRGRTSPVGSLAGDLAGATHVLGADGLVVRRAARPAELGVDLTRRYGAVRDVGPAEPRDLVRRTTVTLAAAEAAGVARWCLETAVEYAKVREQFGQKIGAFQAVKHLCAEMLETCRGGHRRRLGRARGLRRRRAERRPVGATPPTWPR